MVTTLAIALGCSNGLSPGSATDDTTAIDASGADLASVGAQTGPNAIRFEDITDQVGIGLMRAYGVSLVDYDGDGKADITMAEEGGLLVLRSGPDGTFTPDNERSGLPRTLLQAHGVIWADLEGDGDLDLLVTRTEPLFGSVYHSPTTAVLFENDGAGHFTDISNTSGVERVIGAFESASFGDIDSDGDLDLVLGDGSVSGHDDSDPRRGKPNRILLNDGHAHFTDVTATYQCTGEKDVDTWTVVMADLDGDGDLDLFAGNDKEQATVCYGDAKGQLQDASAQFELYGATIGVMGTAVGDLTGDGCLDLFGTVFSVSMLMVPVSDGTVTDWYDAALGDASDPGELISGWGVSLLDADLDGDLDVFWSGAFNTYSENIGKFLPGRLTILENQRTSRVPHLRDVTEEAFPVGIDERHNGYGLSRGDIDGDGDDDVLIGVDSELEKSVVVPAGEVVHRNSMLLRNVSITHGRHSVQLSLSQPGQNPRAVGATVLVETDGRRFAQAVTAGDSYASSNAYLLTFGLGTATSADKVLVRWPDGAVEAFMGVDAGRHTLVRTAPPGRAARSAWPACHLPDAPGPVKHPSEAACRAICKRMDECSWFGAVGLKGLDDCQTHCLTVSTDDSGDSCIVSAPCGPLPDCFKQSQPASDNPQ